MSSSSSSSSLRFNIKAIGIFKFLPFVKRESMANGWTAMKSGTTVVLPVL